MADIFLVPQWFGGFDVALELIFALITLVVGIYSFKVYKLTSKKSVKIFGYSFFLISASYLFQSLMNLLALPEIGESECLACKISEILLYNNLGLIGYMTLFIAGIASLVYMTMAVDNKKIHLLLVLVLTIAIAFSMNKVFMFYLLSSVLLLYIIAYYLESYLQHKQRKTILVILAFCFLLFGSIHFFFAVNHALFYVIGHVLELIAYMLILANLILAIKK